MIQLNRSLTKVDVHKTGGRIRTSIKLYKLDSYLLVQDQWIRIDKDKYNCIRWIQTKPTKSTTSKIIVKFVLKAVFVQLFLRIRHTLFSFHIFVDTDFRKNFKTLWRCLVDSCSQLFCSRNTGILSSKALQLVFRFYLLDMTSFKALKTHVVRDVFSVCLEEATDSTRKSRKQLITLSSAMSAIIVLYSPLLVRSFFQVFISQRSIFYILVQMIAMLIKYVWGRLL